jgi:alanyl-tRNA synthetase
MGAMALFGEKYTDKVRAVRIGSSSIELCGGTHVSNTGAIGLFKIISESSVAAGVRRIEGTTGLGVLNLLGEKEGCIKNVASILKAQENAIVKKAEAIQNELKEAKREIESLSGKMSEIKAEALLNNMTEVGPYKLIAAKVEANAQGARALADTVKAKYDNGVAVFAFVEGGKLGLCVSCGKDAVKSGAHAGNIIKEICAIANGRGGGRPDSAMSGGADPSKVNEVLDAVKVILTR